MTEYVEISPQLGHFTRETIREAAPNLQVPEGTCFISGSDPIPEGKPFVIIRPDALRTSVQLDGLRKGALAIILSGASAAEMEKALAS